jgi:AcrR family transcriptional regulator
MPRDATTPGPARDRLLDAALERFGTDGTVAVSLDDVRLQAGVSVGALYHHFADKAALFEALYVALTEEFQLGFIEELRRHPRAEEGVRAGVAYYLRWVTRHRDGTRVLFSDRPDSAALRELNRAFLHEVKAWWDTHAHYGVVRELPLDLIHALWLGPAHEYARQWLDGPRRRLPTSIVDVLADAAWHTLKEPT